MGKDFSEFERILASKEFMDGVHENFMRLMDATNDIGETQAEQGFRETMCYTKAYTTCALQLYHEWVNL